MKRRFGRLARLGLVALTALAAGCTVRVLDGLAEPEANDLVVALAGAGIHGDKVGAAGRYAVEVWRADFPRAWQVARAAGLPRPRPEPTGRLLPDLRPAHLRADGGARRRAALARELSGLLRVDPRVRDARVVLSPTGAAVSLRANDPDTLDAPSIEARVRAVAGVSGPVAITIHGVEPAPVGLPPPHSRIPLGLATVAVGLMGIACALAWRRPRWWRAARMRARLRGSSPGGTPAPPR